MNCGMSLVQTLIRSDRAILPNASACLQISTPDGSGQVVHPDVAFEPGGFLGYPYWMACTPYPYGQDRDENPVVRVSHDGRQWQVFPGAPDPVISPPEGSAWHYADTDLVIYNKMLHLFFISAVRGGSGTTFSMMTSMDGVHWTPPLDIYRGEWGVSPSVIVDKEGRWSLWYVWRDALSHPQQSLMFRRAGEHPTTLGAPALCVIDIPDHIVWHIDVIAVDGGYEALVAAFPSGTDPSRSRLFHAHSSDGFRFTQSFRRSLLKPTWLGWDNRMIYRSTFIKRPDSTYQLWYSAASWGMRCGIGLLEGKLSEMHAVNGEAEHSISPTRRFFENAMGLTKYLIYRVLPSNAFMALLRIRNQLRRTSPDN